MKPKGSQAALDALLSSIHLYAVSFVLGFWFLARRLVFCSLSSSLILDESPTSDSHTTRTNERTAMQAQGASTELLFGVTGQVTLHDYVINAVMNPMPIPGAETLPISGSYPSLVNPDADRVRPLIEIDQFTDSYFDCNIAERKNLCLHTRVPRLRWCS